MNLQKLILILVCLFSVQAYSLTASNVKPDQIHIFPHAGIFVFYAAVPLDESTPTCAGPHRWAIKTSAPAAKELISMVIAAKAADRTITVVGASKCDQSGFGYEVEYLYFN